MDYIKELKCRECGRPYPKQLSNKGRYGTKAMLDLALNL